MTCLNNFTPSLAPPPLAIMLRNQYMKILLLLCVCKDHPIQLTCCPKCNGCEWYRGFTCTPPPHHYTHSQPLFVVLLWPAALSDWGLSNKSSLWLCLWTSCTAASETGGVDPQQADWSPTRNLPPPPDPLHSREQHGRSVVSATTLKQKNIFFWFPPS